MLPLTFIAGQHGLVIFVPYLVVAFTFWQIVELKRRRSYKSVPVRIAVRSL